MPDDAGTTGASRRQLLIGRRKALGLTQEQLAELLNVDTTTVARWERGETQPLAWLRPKLAKALRVSAARVEEMLAPPERAGPQTTPAVVPRQLPPAVPGFTGRADELTRLTQILDDAAAGAPGTVVISAIGGTAGIGKTALALYWAHQVAQQFPDGQLHANLRGFDPSGSPADPAAVIRTFLDALGVPPERIPHDPDAQAGLYRSMLAGKRMLIVADNAANEQQVRPLLPGSSACLVVVTSRRQLGGLAAAEGARLISLDLLSHAEAVQLLTTRIGSQRSAAEPDAVDQIARLCACLPLALAVASARAAARPGLPLAVLASELADSAGRLDALDPGDPSVSVRAVFSWSYDQLSNDAARMFRLLGLHPGPDISLAAAASLAAVTAADVRRLLGELTRAHLITEHIPGRYAFHDLLRAYATAQAQACDSPDDRDGAVGRVLDHYLHTAARSAYLLMPSKEPLELTPPRSGTVPQQPADYAQAMAWFESEHQVLLAAITLADDGGFSTHAWQLPWAMAAFLHPRVHWGDWTATQRTAIAAATRLGDASAQAQCNRLMALACVELGDYDQARLHFERSLSVYQRIGDHLGQAKIQSNLAVVAGREGRYADALGHDEQALRLFEAAGGKGFEVHILNNIGWDHAQLGNYQQARSYCQRALTLCPQYGDRWLECAVWDSLGYAENHLGNHAEAANCYQHALDIAREVGDRFHEAYALTHIGDARNAADDATRAQDAWQQALDILDELQHPDADQVRAKLAATSNVISELAPAASERHSAAAPTDDISPQNVETTNP